MRMKLLVVGMEALLGEGRGLDGFDWMVFEGLVGTVPAGDRRRKLRSGTRAEAREETPPRLIPGGLPLEERLLLRLAVDGAIRDAARIGSRFPAEETALVVLAPEGDRPGSGRFPFPVFREPSLPAALGKAWDLLSEGRARGVVIGASAGTDQGEEGRAGWTGSQGAAEGGLGLPLGTGAAAVVLQAGDRDGPVGEGGYAWIEGLQSDSRGAGEEGRRPRLDYVEVWGWGPARLEPGDLAALGKIAGGAGEEASCALGSLRSFMGEKGGLSAVAGLIKVALCLHHRYLPGVPGWTGPVTERGWSESPFYVPVESRPCFVAGGETGRRGGVACREDGRWVGVLLSEARDPGPRPVSYRTISFPYLFPLAGRDAADLAEGLDRLSRGIGRGEDLNRLAWEALARFRERRDSTSLALAVVGHRREDLLKEAAFLRKGVLGEARPGREWKTPRGSCFTPTPLGGEGKVAFVYPGVGSAYVGLGRGLFRLFPGLFERFASLTPDMGGLLKETLLYPRTVRPLDEKEIWRRELELRRDITTVGECGTGFFVLFTLILREVFGVSPELALGYSMGEPGMLAALGVWVDPGRLPERFARSPVFRERLNGALTAVREYWGRRGEGPRGAGEKIWETFTLQAPPEVVGEALREDQGRVFLTIVNTAEEVVIAGDPVGCSRVIERIGCRHYPLSLNLAIHCEPARLEYDRIVELYTLPVEGRPQVKFYSSSCYRPIPIRSKAVAHSIAKAYCEPVDFPRLVTRAYEDGARIFIEIGSRKFCCNLIEKILEGREHVAAAVNVKGTRDEASLARLLARLVSHRVPVDLSALVSAGRGGEPWKERA